MSRPAWQTDELDEEWIEEEEESLNITRSGASATSSISLTEAIGSLDITDQHRRSNASQGSHSEDPRETAPRGTFVVREDVEAVPLMPKTPGKTKGGMAGMFTPLALEKMFEPPSPPTSSTSQQPGPVQPSPSPSAGPHLSTRPSPLSQSHLPVPERPVPTVHITPSTSFNFAPSPDPLPTSQPDAHTPNVPSTEFTFSAPRSFTPSPFNPTHGRNPLAESTPGPSKPKNALLNIATSQPGLGSSLSTLRPREPPSTDPRLRLFQFQYDTFTREHLSAILDNMPVANNSPSTTNFSPNGTAPFSAGPSVAFTPSPLSAGYNASFAPSHLDEVSAVSDEDPAGSINRMRATKRVKLSSRDDPSSAFPQDEEDSEIPSTQSRKTNESYGEGAGAGAHIARPKGAAQGPLLLQVPPQAIDQSSSRKDYVKESMAFMQQLKANRDFSTVSTMSAIGDGSRVISDGWYHVTSYELCLTQIEQHERLQVQFSYRLNLRPLLLESWRWLIRTAIPSAASVPYPHLCTGSRLMTSWHGFGWAADACSLSPLSTPNTTTIVVSRVPPMISTLQQGSRMSTLR